jgi:secreted trypsin-like serine protease
MFRKLFVLGIILVLAFVSSSPAQAISYGEFDGTAHPFVGSIVIRIPDEGTFQICSGTLISDNVFLTASHCTVPLDVYVVRYPGSTIGVVFEPTISDGSLIYEGVWHTNPNYNYYAGQYGNADPGDVAVIVLDESPGITPASLPTARLLDNLKAQHLLNDTLFTAVGYGTVRDTKQGGWQPIMDNLDRNRADQEFNSLTNAWLTNSMNIAIGNGGTCYGDSGGPHFIHLGGAETNIVASITVTGDAQCKASDKTYRMDTESARNFLADYVTLP